MTAHENQTITCHVNDALNYINQAEYGAHYIIIYPDLDTLRKLYSNYIHKQLKENNEIVLLNPFYETTDSVRRLLSQGNPGLDVSKYEKEKSLIIIDSLEEYFGKQPDMPFKRSLATHAKQIGKNGLSILGDIGAYPHQSKHKDLVDYESSLPTKYDVPMKGFCLYHQQDFDEFSEEQKQKLLEHHGKALKIMEMKSQDTSLFEQPLDFVRHVKEGQHIVLFYEELEYAKMISFQFIKNGLAQKKDCVYVSEEDVEPVKREMADSGIDVDKFTTNGLLHIYQAPSLTNYQPSNSSTEHIRRRLAQSERIVLRCVYKINTQEQIESNLKWEHEYRLKELKDGTTTILCTYPVDNIMLTISDSTGAYGKWMNDLLSMYDRVIFARRFWKGVAFNLN